jgi:hypothetical protein
MHKRSSLVSPSFRLNADNNSVTARDALAAAIALHSTKFKKVGFKGISCRVLPFGITGLRTTGSLLNPASFRLTRVKEQIQEMINHAHGAGVGST